MHLRAESADSIAEALGLEDLEVGRALQSALVVPMIAAQRLEGVVVLASRAAGTFSAGDDEVAATVASAAATAMRHARLYAESERERRTTEALSSVASAVGESLRLGEVQHMILRHALALLRAEGASIAMAEGRYVNIVASVGSSAILAGMHLPMDASIVGRVIRESSYAIVNDVPERADAFKATQRLAGIRRALMVPLITSRGTIGVLAANDRDTDFTEEDARTLQRLADQVAVAVVNAQLFEEARHSTQEWRVLFDAVPSGVLVLDEDGRIARFNARALQLADAGETGTLFGRWFTEAVLGDDADAPLPSSVQRALVDGVVGRETVRVKARGRLYDLLASPHPEGGAVVTVEDITGLHALEVRYRTLVETATDAIVITDPERRISFANRAAEELFGASATLTGMPVSRLVDPTQRDRVAEAHGRAMIGETQRYETTIVRGDGEPRIVAVSSGALRDASGVIGTVASLRDVTDERRVRDAVSLSEARYRNLFEHASDAIYTLDRRGVLTSANSAAAALTGLPVPELLGRSIGPLIAAEDRSRAEGLFARAVSGEAQRYEAHMRRPDGAMRLISVTNTPIRDGSQILGVLGIARDITDERSQAEALAQSEARYSRLLESASDAIFAVDATGTITSVNRILERTLGRRRRHLIGQPVTALIAMTPDGESLQRIFVETLRGDRHRTEIRYRDKRKELRDASLVTAPITDDAGRVTGVLAVVRDVTDERRLREQLLLQDKLAAIGQLVSGVAHELNNPLAGILAHAQLLLASPTVQGDHRLEAEVIHQEGRRAAKIIGNLLTFARRHRPERALTDLAAVVHDTLALRRYSITVAGVALDVDVPESLPVTWADPFQLQQVMLNLLTNAEQALADVTGTRRLQVRASADEEWLVLEIADTGPGIPRSVADQIFNPFFTTKPVGKGTGLGLSIADGIVREHGGRIVVESTPGAGTTFRVELPLVSPPDDFFVRAHRTSAPRVRSVLVADADSTARHVAARFLAEHGHAVETVSSASAALELIGAQHWDAILIDLDLPDGGGLAVYSQLRARDAALAGRVVFTAPGLPGTAERLQLDATGRPWVAKPYDVPTLPSLLFGG
jgi:PAS domain S-box-containing protein